MGGHAGHAGRSAFPCTCARRPAPPSPPPSWPRDSSPGAAIVFPPGGARDEPGHHRGRPRVPRADASSRPTSPASPVFSLALWCAAGPALRPLRDGAPRRSMTGAVESGLGWLDVAGGARDARPPAANSARRSPPPRAPGGTRLSRALASAWGSTPSLAHAAGSPARLGSSWPGLPLDGHRCRPHRRDGLPHALRPGRSRAAASPGRARPPSASPLEQLPVRAHRARSEGSEVGFRDDPGALLAGADPQRTTEVIEVTTGDETLLQVPYAVHYTDRRRLPPIASGSRTPVGLVVALSSTALQRAASAPDHERDPGRRAAGTSSSDVARDR